MKRTFKWRIAIILAVIGLSIWAAWPLSEKINLGLDLQGGMHLVLKVDTSKIAPEARKDAPERALEVVRNRIDQFGVKEPSIQLQGKDEIVVQLPGVTDRQRALDLIGKTALLEFKLVSDDTELFRRAIAGEVPEGFELKEVDGRPILLEKKAALAGDALTTAAVRFDQTRFNEPIVELEFNTRGAKEFAQITAANVGRQLAIVLDGEVQSAPRINEAIPSGRAVITGRFSQDEARDLAIVLRVGALPAPVYVEEERTIGPLLGQDSIRAGIKASIVGSIAVFCFAILYYLLAGVIASIALMLNFIIILGALAYFRSTLTLPGIAGIVLTLGMAIDANVLINERIREELGLGRPIKTAISNGYTKAFSAILDSNVTTLIAAFLLFQFGTGPIRGFAVTLSIGLLASMFTAIVVTRVIFDLLTLSKRFTRIKMLRFMGQTKIDFIGKRKIFYISSLLIVTLGMVLFFSKGKAAYGVDFTGGQLQEYSFEKPVAIGDVRSALKDIGLGTASIQQLVGHQNGVLIRTDDDTEKQVSGEFEKRFKDNKFQIMRIEKVGPAVGKALRTKAVLALFYSLLGILVYVWIRFKRIDYAVAGIVALFHDVFFAIGMLAITNRQMSLLIISAILTIAGYSINDTIVIYDRIREILRMAKKTTFGEVINMAVNQTLARTLLTTFATLLVVISLYFFGGEVLNDFAFCLLVGFISGVYSTVFIASPLLLAWHKRR